MHARVRPPQNRVGSLASWVHETSLASRASWCHEASLASMRDELTCRAPPSQQQSAAGEPALHADVLLADVRRVGELRLHVQ